MIVFDLKCAGGEHVFEAWFSNSSAYEDQRARRLISCPICGDVEIEKALMTPNVGAKGNKGVANPASAQAVALPEQGAAAEVKAMMGKIAAIQAESLKTSRWVGTDFERQARAMEAGETDRASIHGQATPDQAKAMMEDGIAVMPLLVPVVPPDQQN